MVHQDLPRKLTPEELSDFFRALAEPSDTSGVVNQSPYQVANSQFPDEPHARVAFKIELLVCSGIVSFPEASNRSRYRIDPPEAISPGLLMAMIGNRNARDEATPGVPRLTFLEMHIFEPLCAEADQYGMSNRSSIALTLEVFPELSHNEARRLLSILRGYNLLNRAYRGYEISCDARSALFPLLRYQSAEPWSEPEPDTSFTPMDVQALRVLRAHCDRSGRIRGANRLIRQELEITENSARQLLRRLSQLKIDGERVYDPSTAGSWVNTDLPLPG